MSRSFDFPEFVAHVYKADADLIAGCSPIAAQKSERIETLGCFRGIAILMVICGQFLPQRLVFVGLRSLFRLWVAVG